VTTVRFRNDQVAFDKEIEGQHAPGQREDIQEKEFSKWRP